MAKILVAEDNPITAEMLSARLACAGHAIVLAADGRAALERAIETRPDVILLDVMMPELDGFEVLQRLKADPVLGSIPVVMLSARAQEQDILTALANGADDYVTKPFRFRELLARLERVQSEGPGHLRVAVRHGSGSTAVGELVQGSPWDASIRFPREDSPTLAIGDRATLCIRSVALPQGIEMPATLDGRAEIEPHRRYRFRLHALDAPESEVARAFLRLIGRRMTTRVRLDPPAAALLQAGGRGEPEPHAAALHDVSVTGARLVLKGPVDRRLAGTDRCEIRFALPGCAVRFELAASIRHREACEGGVAYGTRFEEEGSQRLLEQQREIADFVVRQQGGTR